MRHGCGTKPKRPQTTLSKRGRVRIDLRGATLHCINQIQIYGTDIWTRKGLTRYVVMFLIDLSTRGVEIAGIAAQANGLWMAQVARNLNDDVDGFLMGKRYLIHDRDPLYAAEFLGTLGTAGVKSVKLPPRSPNLNAHAERFVRTIKESCLERVILFGEGSLRKAIHELIAHYHY